MQNSLSSGSYKKSLTNDVAVGITCILVFTLLNPFLALLFLAVLATFHRIPTFAFLVAAPISFALFFFFREYGVDWSPGSGDDVPGYLLLYNENALISFWEIFARFLESPGSYEPFWHSLWWPLLNVFGASEEVFIFTHYLLIFFVVFFSFFILSRRYFIALSLIYFFATPLSIESITFLWRQQLAFSMFLIGIGVYMVRGKNIGKWLIYLSPLMHVAMIYFVVVFVTFDLYNKYVGLDSVLKFVLIAILNLFAITIISPIAITYLSSLGLDRVESYLEGSGDEQTSVFISIGIYSVLLFLVHLKLKNDDVNNLFIVVLFSVFGIMLAFPGATGIYVRFLMFAFPLYGLYFFRCYLMNFSTRWHILVLSLVFLSGAIRMYRTTQYDLGVVRYLAFGNAFDPSMGMLRMLLSFLG